MGKAAATGADFGGLNKTFFFVHGSKFGGDGGLFLNRTLYETEVDGSKVYDTSGDDPLGYYSPNRYKAEKKIRDAGYEGIYVETQDGDC
jgi:hypothetical protein